MESTTLSILKGNAFTPENPGYMQLVNNEQYAGLIDLVSDLHSNIGEVIAQISDNPEKTLQNLNNLLSVVTKMKLNTDQLSKLGDILNKLDDVNGTVSDSGTHSALADVLAKLSDVSISNFPDTQTVELSGSNIKHIEKETLLNAVSIEAGSSTDQIDMGITNETEIWILVNIDQQPWSLLTSANNTTSLLPGNSSPVFPQKASVTKTFQSSNAPSTSIFYGLRADTNTNIAPPTTISEARNLQLQPLPGNKLRVDNESANTATITIVMIRVWGG